CDGQRVTAYPDEVPPTAVRIELVRALLLALIRPDALTPRETDIAARIAMRYADACIVDRKPRDGLAWAIDLAGAAGAAPAGALADPPETVRYFGTAAIIAKVEEVMRRLHTDPGLKEQRFGEEYAREEKFAVLERAVRFWGAAPPRMRDPRTPAQA